MSLIKCPICENFIDDCVDVCCNCGCKTDQIVAYLKNDKNKIFDGFDIVNGLLKKYYGHSKSIIIPPSTKRINFDVFSNSNIENVVISDNVINISSRAFYNCTNLRKVIIGKEVKVIGSDAFENCKNLRTVEFLGDAWLDFCGEIFNNCNSLEEIICINESVKANIELSCCIDSSFIKIKNKDSNPPKNEELKPNDNLIEKPKQQKEDNENNIHEKYGNNLTKQDFDDAYNKIMLFLKKSEKLGSIRELLNYVKDTKIFEGCEYRVITRKMSNNSSMKRGLYVEIPSLNYKTNHVEHKVVINRIIELIKNKYNEYNKFDDSQKSEEIKKINNKNNDSDLNNNIITKQDYVDTYNAIQLYLESTENIKLKKFINYFKDNKIFNNCSYNLIYQSDNCSGLEYGIHLVMPRVNFKTHNVDGKAIVNNIIEFIKEKGGINDSNRQEQLIPGTNPSDKLNNQDGNSQNNKKEENVIIADQDYIDAYNVIIPYIKDHDDIGLSKFVNHFKNVKIFKDCFYNVITNEMGSNKSIIINFEMPNVNYKTSNKDGKVIISNIISMIKEKAKIQDQPKYDPVNENENFISKKKNILETLKKFSILEKNVIICKAEDNTPF